MLQIDVRPTSLNGRKFVQCCFIVSGNVIGDFEQRMLLGSLKLAVIDLIGRLRIIPTFDFCGSKNIEKVFDGMSAAFLKGEFYFFQENDSLLDFGELDSNRFSGLPLAVEAFDGEEAYLFKFEDKWRFAWRQWETKKVDFVCLNKDLLIQSLEAALKLMQTESDKDSSSDTN